ncbi:transglutaminase-like domain-containing protein [Thermohalobacter berrensis]|uniref:Transglutaminase-like domain-containing protein n=1 Tax=Thermohalobacter berrensis TaxID=99594 RepID=A0A419T867_9FIRM|nr:transglutaminase domain-containing protein [Thermohalobacter berrensis]RKD33744.1 hypothetical protein BET03_08445 [Thermohalobacter berrensis]
MDKNDKSTFIFKLYINIFINYFLIRLLFDTLEIEHNLYMSLIILLLSAVSIVLIYIIWKKPLILASVVLILFPIMIFMYRYEHEIYLKMLQKIDDFIIWASRFLSGLTFLYNQYFYILVVLIIFLLSLITFVFVFKIKSIYPLTIFGTILFLYRWFLFLDKALIYYIFYIMLVLQLYTYRVYKKKENLWINKSISFGPAVYKRWIIYSTSVVVIIVSIVSVFPKNFAPITWRWLDDKVQEIFPQVTEWRNSRKASENYGSSIRFDLSLTQYQESHKRLGGPINRDNVLMMKVKSKEPLYLKGIVKDFYTGAYWKSTEDVFHEQISNTDLTIHKNKEIKGELIVQTIEHINLTTSTLFNSYIPIKVSLEDNTFYTTDEYELFAGILLTKNQRYTIYSIKKEINRDDMNTSSYKKRKEHEKYLQLPEILPKRVVELAKKITKGYKNDYDKVNALVKYLRENYKYTLTPPETPYNRDFVDYFLFDLKEGYCTYFASSLAVLTRSIGIPSRYVEGFKTPNEKDAGIYYVYSSNAHAWTEVYIENIGWVPFEATPAYTGINYDEYFDEKQVENNNETLSNNEITDYRTGNDDMKNSLLENLLQEESNVSVNDFKEEKDNSKGILVIFIILVLLLLSRIIYSYIKIKKILEYDYRENKREGIIKYYLMILSLFKLINKQKLEHETCYEYSNRIIKALPQYLDKLPYITDIFIKSRYGKEEINEDEVLDLKNYFLKCEEYVKKQIGLLKFLFLKYIMMKIYNIKVE